MQNSKKYNYYYSGSVVSHSVFLQGVPENWEQEVETGEYSYGYYRAIEAEEEEEEEEYED